MDAKEVGRICSPEAGLDGHFRWAAGEFAARIVHCFGCLPFVPTRICGVNPKRQTIIDFAICGE